MIRKGFTLVEVLVAFVIFSIVVVVTVFSLKFSLNLFEKLNLIDVYRPVVLTKLMDSIKSIYFFPLKREKMEFSFYEKKDEWKVFFEGTEKKVSFVSAFPILHKDENLYNLYFVDVSNSDKGVIIEEFPVFDKNTNYRILKSKSVKIKVIPWIEKVRFEYFVDGRWLKRSKDIPECIKLHLSFSSGDVVDLIVSVKSNYIGILNVIKYKVELE